MINRKKIIKHSISTVIVVIAIITLVVVYSKYNYNDFTKSVHERDKTSFTRDHEIRYSKMDSYKVENMDYNDAMFFETVPVTPDTPYKVTCKVKVENVENENKNKIGGAHICIAGGTERSIIINGTQDWQELTFLFNSKNRKEVNIGFRLGGYEEKTKGIAWFSDLKIEAGTVDKNEEWKFACFIFPKIDVDVKVNGKAQHVSLTMSDSDIQDLRVNLDRFKSSITNMSRNKMKADYDIYIIDQPIKTLSYDKENGYYVAPEDVYEYISPYVEKNEYDHIYVGIRMADVQTRKCYIN